MDREIMLRQLMLVAVVPGLVFRAAAGEPEVQQVRGIVDPSTLRLAGGEVIRVAGVHVPQAQALAAQQALRDEIGRARQILVGGATFDRYGRRAARVVVEDGRSLAALLVGRGLAIVQPTSGSGLDHAELLILEGGARDARLGVWADPAGPLATADTVADLIGRYGVVEGRIRSVGPTDHHVYLNFGADWRSDFTLRIRRAELKDVTGRSVEDVERLAGRTVRSRGLVIEAGGPLIELSHPEQIEVLP